MRPLLLLPLLCTLATPALACDDLAQNLAGSGSALFGLRHSDGAVLAHAQDFEVECESTLLDVEIFLRGYSDIFDPPRLGIGDEVHVEIRTPDLLQVVATQTVALSHDSGLMLPVSFDFSGQNVILGPGTHTFVAYTLEQKQGAIGFDETAAQTGRRVSSNGLDGPFNGLGDSLRHTVNLDPGQTPTAPVAWGALKASF